MHYRGVQAGFLPENSFDFYKKSDKFSSKSDWRAEKCSLTAVKIAVKERGRFITN
jgi:hypothetical protein